MLFRSRVLLFRVTESAGAHIRGWRQRNTLDRWPVDHGLTDKHIHTFIHLQASHLSWMFVDCERAEGNPLYRETIALKAISENAPTGMKLA